METVREKKNFASLDMMRGLSALAVLVAHVDSLVAGGKSTLPLDLGGIAVQVFMLISGFLMMWHFLERNEKGDRWGQRETYGKFYIRRFFRIAPLYYVLLTLCYLFASELSFFKGEVLAEFAPNYVPNAHNPNKGSGIGIAHVLAHYSFLFGFIPRFAQSTPMPDWSIGLEMQFYLFFPLIAVMLLKSRYYIGALVLVGLSWLARDLIAFGLMSEPKALGLFPYPTFLPLMLDRFLLGILIAAAFYEKSGTRKQVLLLLLVFAIAACSMKKLGIAAALFVIYELLKRYGGGFSFIDHIVQLTDRIFSHRFTKFLADTSYCVYLIHLPMLFFVIPLTVRFSSYETLTPVARIVVMLAIILPPLYGISYVAFRYIEMPGINLGRRLVKRLH